MQVDTPKKNNDETTEIMKYFIYHLYLNLRWWLSDTNWE